MLTFLVVVVWESREQPAAALNHRCTEYWAVRTTCSTECNALSREERWKLRQPKNESCALPARSQPFTSSGGRLSHFWQREILPKKLQIGIPPYRHYYENFCATRPKMVFCHKSHLVLAKKLTDLLGVLFADKMFSKERFTIASHKFLQHRHKHWNHLHLLRYYTFAATIVTIIIRDARIYQFCSFLTLFKKPLTAPLLPPPHKPPFDHLLENFCHFYAFTIGLLEFCRFSNMGLTPSPPMIKKCKIGKLERWALTIVVTKLIDL